MKQTPFDELSGRYDVVIVGAGPSGASTAGYLSNALSTLIIDRNSLPRDKPCGGILKEDALDFLRGFDIPDEVFLEPKKIDLKYLDWDNGAELKQNRYLLNVSRLKFDEWLISLIGDYVAYSARTELIDFVERGDHIDVTIEKNNIIKEIKCNYLVGATGASSFVRKRLIKKVPPNNYIAVQEWIKNVDGINEFLYILDREITDFYSWVIPKGNLLLIGSAFPTGDNAYKKRFELLKKKMEEKLEISGPVYKKEAALLIKPRTVRDICLGNHNTLLVGEEAGLISPTTAEGISFALKSGYNCAKAINKMGTVLEAYKDSSNDLIEDIKNKLKKADVLFNPEKRPDLLESEGNGLQRTLQN